MAEDVGNLGFLFFSRGIRRGVAVTVMGVALASCVTQTVKQVPVKVAMDIPMGQGSKPIAFRKIILKIPRSQLIGSLGGGFLCVKYAERRARSGRYKLDESLFSEVFRETLENHNYTVVGNPDALFEDTSLDRAEYFIAGLIKGIATSECYPNTAFGDFSTSSASVYMKVEWQVYKTLSRKVVYSVTTEGSANQEALVDNAIEVALADAFGLATQNLLADKEFHSLLSENEEKPSKKFAEKIKIKKLRVGESKKFDPVEIRPGVVTVRTATGHGSGFFISSDGFLLTNQHVVGDSKTVRIILHSGRHVPGEVLRTDSVRDVALVKVGEAGFPALSLNFRKLPVGSDVLVYGTPLTEKLEGTLTKGIISAYRSDKGKSYLQSDATIQGGSSGGPMLDVDGNVIALTVLTYVKGGVASGHALFIPILEAFESLGIEVPRGAISPQS